MTTRWRWPASYVAIGILAGVVVSACGGDDNSSAPKQRPRAPEPARAFEIRVGPDNYRLGPYEIGDIYRDPDASLAGAERALGKGTCKPDEYGTIIQVAWEDIGVKGQFATLGSLDKPDGTPDPTPNGCEHRDQMRTSTLRFTDPRWHTDRGLRIGDAEDRLLELYPAAEKHREDVAHIGGWWLHKVSSRQAEVRSGPDLIAKVRSGRVAELMVLVGAQGD